MREFWDARAAENPYFFVDSRLDYRRPDEAGFWDEGLQVIKGFERQVDLAIDPDDVVVEIGCGIGRITRVLAARAERVIAVDVSDTMLGLAQDLSPDLANVDWVLGDGSTLAAVPDSSADGCFSFVTFQHIPDPELTFSYIREMGRVLRPGGWAAFQLSTSPTPGSRPALATRLRLAALALLRRGPRGQTHPAWVGSTVEVDDLRAAAAEAGLEIRRLVGAGTLFSLVHAVRVGPAPD